MWSSVDGSSQLNRQPSTIGSRTALFLTQREEPPIEYISMTSFLFRRITYVAGIALVGIATLFSIALPVSVLYGAPILVATPLTVLSLGGIGVGIYLAGLASDLSDPKQLEFVRKEIWKEFSMYELQEQQGSLDLFKGEASHLFLSWAKKYGWNEIFGRKLIDPADFSRMFVFQGSLLPIGEVLDLHDEVVHAIEENAAYEEYEIPPASIWRPKWIETIRAFESNLEAFESVCDDKMIERLIDHGILDAREAAEMRTVYQQFTSSRKTFLRETEEERKEYERWTAPSGKVYREKVREIESAFRKEPVHAQLKEKRRSQIQREMEVEEQRRSDPRYLRAQNEKDEIVTSLESIVRVQPHLAMAGIARAHSRCDRIGTSVRQKYDKIHFNAIDSYRREMNPLLERLQTLQVRRDKRLVDLQVDFEQKCRFAKDRRDHSIARPLHVFEDARRAFYWSVRRICETDR